MKLTAPTTVTTSNQQISLTIYACSQAGTEAKCNAEFTEVASLTVSATVPEFTFGIAAVVAIGLVGLMLVKRRSLPKIAAPSVGTTVA
jgi:hypothetical protein